MDLLLQALQQLPEFRQLLDTVQSGGAAAATGLAQINRAHVIAGLYDLGDRPLAVICQDDLAAKRLQGELKAFLGQEPPVLPGRDLNLYDAAVVSRVWEQRRLRQLYDLGKGQTRLQIFSWESMSLRTMPKSALFAAAFQLRLGVQVSVEELLARLVAMGYSRAPMWRGPASLPSGGESWTCIPRRRDSQSGWSSLETSWIPWATSTPTPNVGRRMWRKSQCCPWRRASRASIPGVFQGCSGTCRRYWPGRNGGRIRMSA